MLLSTAQGRAALTATCLEYGSLGEEYMGQVLLPDVVTGQRHIASTGYKPESSCLTDFCRGSARSQNSRAELPLQDE